MSQLNNTAPLIGILQLAYSGELAAAYAYRGHWKSVSDPEERRRIEEIENEEWHHRKLVGEMLSSLNAEPDQSRESRAAIIGRVFGFGCHVIRLAGANVWRGTLESRNIREYETAARLAHECGRDDLIDCLLTMAETEWEHERYFRSLVITHRFAKFLPIWPEPPGKESIRGAQSQSIS